MIKSKQAKVQTNEELIAEYQDYRKEMTFRASFSENEWNKLHEYESALAARGILPRPLFYSED